MKNVMRTFYVAILFVLLVLTIPNDAKGSHAMGADLTYTCLGPGPTPGSFTYQFTYSFYRDCSGIPAPAQPNMVITNSCGYSVLPVNLIPIPSTPTDSNPTQITPICPSVTSTCEGGSYTGIFEWIYQVTVTLPGPCHDWTFSHSESARNTAITTLAPGGSGNLYVYTVINNTSGICNNSPTFSNNPVPFACVGQRFCFNHGAYDADGDSLTYQILTPRTGALPGDTVSYLPGYSPTQPVISNPPMSFNPLTGDFCMNPTQPDVTVLAILVNEWRNGVLIGQIERDIQVTVEACNNILPSITGINGAPFFTSTVCAGNQLCFFIRSIDPDASDTTIITWDQGIPSASFTTTNTKRDSAYFCWTPTAADISLTPYCFTVTVTDNSCPYLGVQVYSFCITVTGVDPDAGPDQSVTCGTTVNLTGSATGGNGVYNYTWNPGNVNSQTLNNVGVGTYYLTVNSAGCSNTDTVELLPGLGQPAANFSFTTSCSGTPVLFTDLSSVTGSTISGWLWDFGDGNTDNTQNPSHLYATNNVYTVTLTVTTPSNCTSSTTQQVSFNANVPVAQFSSPPVCDGSSMTFTDQSTGGPMTTWSWDFNDPSSGSNTSNLQNPVHTFSGPGTYNVSLNVVNIDGCTHTTQQSVTVNANPTFSISDAGMCEGTQATLNGPPGFATYSWSNGDITQSITVNPIVTTVYSLTATDINGCIGNSSATVTVDPVPVPDAGMDQTICEGTSTNLSGIGVGGNVFTWNPGNMSGQNVTVNPSATTSYTLTVATSAGCSATDDVTVTVNPMPAANAGSDGGICDGESITINSVVGAGNITWTPGNYNTASITVAPTATTTYTLVVSDAIGCTGSDTVTVVVYPIPVAQIINPNPQCGNNSIVFQDGSTVASGSITNWLWDFGNGQTSTSQSPSVTYANAGSYPVSLSIVTDGGCTDTESATQIIWANPSAAFTHTNACEGNAIDFSNSSTISDASALSYLWNLGDNTTTGSVNVTHQYSSYGTYSASLLVTSVNGCIDSISSLVNVYALPQAAIVLDYACEDATASFTDGSSIPQGIINSWFWTMGDGNSSILPNPSHIYSDPGNYPVHLLVTSDHGCLDSTNAIMRIAPRPVVDFETENDCLGFPVDFTDMSNSMTGPIVTYDWRFGDGNTSNLQNPQHLYSSSGWFEVSLTATTDSGCSTTLERNNALQIYQPPYAYFSSNASVADDIYPLVNFFNETGVSGQYFWNFGDGDTSTQYSPTHLYPDIGKYDVLLVAIDQYGCIDSTLLRIEIKPSSNVYIPNAFTPNGDAENDLFQVYSYNVKTMAVQIYDRWGLKIKEWKDVYGSWDGRVDGNPAQNDTYVYRVETVDVNDVKEVRVGHVSLIR